MKCHWKHILALAAIAVMGALAPTAHAELIGYWPFEETLEDNSGNDFTAEALGPVGYDANGFRGAAVDLGDFNNGAAVKLPEEFATGDNGFNKIVASQEVTISFNLNRQGDAPTNAWTFLFGGSRQLGSHAPWSDGNVYFDVAGCCGGNQRIATGLGDANTDGGWHHLAYVKKANAAETDKAITAVFLDGTPIVTSPGCDAACWLGDAETADWGAATIDPVVAIDAATIGGDNNGGSSHDGLIDEFAIWDEALPVGRIQAIAEGAGVQEGPGPDFNGDGTVDIADFNIMRENFGGRFAFGESGSKGDYNGDLRVNLKDFFAFRADFNAGAVGAQAVPEPSSCLLFGMMLVGLLTHRRRRS